MNSDHLFAAFLLVAAVQSVQAAPPVYIIVDNSPSLLMDRSTAEALWQEQMTSKLARLYPAKKWGFVSEVEGGFDDEKICVITARAMVLPRSGRALVYRPTKTATAFGTRAGASHQQCRTLAKAKLREAIEAVGSALLAQ
jgi:hypothetical protein